MSENAVSGGAGPALAAHSKDASALGQTPASSAMSSPGKASATNDRRPSEILGSASLDHIATFVLRQPFVAAAVAGAIGLAWGLLLGRRRP